MRRSRGWDSLAAFSVMLGLFVGASTLNALPQSAELQQRLAELKDASAKNKQAIAQYTWQQQETVSVNGEVRKQALYQVQVGSDGKPVKTEISQNSSSGGGRRHGIRHRVTESYEQYGSQLASLAQSYAQPDPSVLQQRLAQGDVSLKPGGAAGTAIVVTNYVKQGDSVSFDVNRQQKTITAMSVATYLSDPSDKVTIGVQFAQLPDGTNHVSTVNVNGQSKNLNVLETNTNYQKR